MNLLSYSYEEQKPEIGVIGLKIKVSPKLSYFWNLQIKTYFFAFPAFLSLPRFLGFWPLSPICEMSIWQVQSCSPGSTLTDFIVTSPFSDSHFLLPSSNVKNPCNYIGTTWLFQNTLSRLR